MWCLSMMSANTQDFEENDEENLLQTDPEIENDDELALLQAAVFVEDAFKYRSIHHKIDVKSLKLYKVYYSRSFQWIIAFVIFFHLSLAFIEPPSTLSWSSDPRKGFNNKRTNVPCGVTEAIEILFLIFYIVDFTLKVKLFGKKHFYKSKWLWGYFFVLMVSVVDWIITVNFGCSEKYRVRRILRPYFLLQTSSLMKKTVRAIWRTVPQILSIFLVLFLHLIIFTLLGMLLLSKSEVVYSNVVDSTNSTRNYSSMNESTTSNIHRRDYFGHDFEESFMKLLVLLTTANNPDVMMPAYKENRFYAIYFIIFTFIGLYCFMNLLLAVVYSQFQGYLKNSLQSSYFRLRTGLRAAFEVLRERSFDSSNPSDDSTVSTSLTRRLIQKVDFGRKNIDIIWDTLDRNRLGRLNVKQFQDLFDSVSRQKKVQHPPLSRCSNKYLRTLQKIAICNYFNYFGLLVVIANVIIIGVELSRNFGSNSFSSHSYLSVCDLCFIVYYAVEQCLKIWAFGWQRYVTSKQNKFDMIITFTLVIAQIVDISLYGLLFNTSQSRHGSRTASWNILKLVNILIIFRLVRVLFNVKSLSVIASSLAYLLRNLKPFGGVIVAVYYSYAIFGMMIFENEIQPLVSGNSTTNFTCGTYEQLEYWANNFNDFGASLVVLWDAMVVNNWHVFLHAYMRYTNRWSQLYFVTWYLISVVICVNLFVALLLDVFIDRWEERQKQNNENRLSEEESRTLTQSFMIERKSFRVHEMFSEALNEPTEDDVIRELVYHGFTFRSHPSGGQSQSTSDYDV
ncbi:two pore channel protein 2-like [Xenia sp. Carnegie-2017]|uniref:two pore channel protein 2-like n=1 Tax=Xenia sp. Carnegie-2017 TaxID=2897299 RepID=UPI001F04E549|nr:two pore channel protein 2-like [Xenia sp. Carnegie-2017]